MDMYNLIDNKDNYAKTSGILSQFSKDIPAVDNNNTIVNCNGANVTDSFNFKVKMPGQTGDDGTKSVEIIFGEL